MQSFNYSLGVYMALRPSLTGQRAGLRRMDYLNIWALYLVAGLAGFATPISVFDALRSHLYRLAKRSRAIGPAEPTTKK